jgi:flavodoxin
MNKRKWTIKSIVSIICIIILLSPVANIQAASKEKLNKTAVTIEVDKTVRLRVLNLKKSIKWSSKNKSVATVSSNGLVKGKKAGTTSIAAKFGSKTLTCKITVKKPVPQSPKALVVYFSMPETANPNNMTSEEKNSTVIINGKVQGNTQYVANLIQENTGADLFRIEPEKPYPTDHRTLVDLAKEEQNNEARPKLAANVKNIDQYDVIFVGYPNWWGDMPMILYSFLESVDLSGKTVIPFNTHGGSGFSDTINTIAELQPGAAVNKKGFTVSRDTVQDCAEDVKEWLKELKLKK